MIPLVETGRGLRGRLGTGEGTDGQSTLLGQIPLLQRQERSYIQARSGAGSTFARSRHHRRATHPLPLAALGEEPPPIRAPAAYDLINRDHRGSRNRHAAGAARARDGAAAGEGRMGRDGGAAAAGALVWSWRRSSGAAARFAGAAEAATQRAGLHVSFSCTRLCN